MIFFQKIIVQNEVENLKENKYLLELKQKYGTKLVQIMHEYYFFFLIQYGVLDHYNYKWKPLKNFDAIIYISFTAIKSVNIFASVFTF